jgi:hypothetical protein
VAGPNVLHMKDSAPPAARAGAAAALIAASLVSLAGGAFLAVPLHGVLRFAVGFGGFAGYVALFARALRRLGLPAEPILLP